MSCFRFGPWIPKIKNWAGWWSPGRVELLLLTSPSVLLGLRWGEDAAGIFSSKKDAADTIREDQGGPITTAELADTSTCKPCAHNHTIPVATGCAGSWLGLEHGCLVSSQRLSERHQTPLPGMRSRAIARLKRSQQRGGRTYALPTNALSSTYR